MRREIGGRDFPDRYFKMWAYVVSHRRLLLRSPKSDIYTHNIDIHFDAVDYLRLPAIFQGLRLSRRDDLRATSFTPLLGDASSESRVFSLTSGGEEYIVVAARVFVEENDYLFMETPLWGPFQAPDSSASASAGDLHVNVPRAQASEVLDSSAAVQPLAGSSPDE